MANKIKHWYKIEIAFKEKVVTGYQSSTDNMTEFITDYGRLLSRSDNTYLLTDTTSHAKLTWIQFAPQSYDYIHITEV